MNNYNIEVGAQHNIEIPTSNYMFYDICVMLFADNLFPFIEESGLLISNSRARKILNEFGSGIQVNNVDSELLSRCCLFMLGIERMSMSTLKKTTYKNL